MPDLSAVADAMQRHGWHTAGSRKQRLRDALFTLAAGIAPEGDWNAVRAPGRVNLIGEHTDYNGLPVMPMALDREITLLFRPLDVPLFRLINVDAAFQPGEFHVKHEIPHSAPGDWINYAKAAAAAVFPLVEEGHVRGVEACVAGDIPPGAGLSSSSALVVACALAFARVNGVNVPPKEMADLLAAGERYVGTQGGGMDQAVCLMAGEGEALRIDFHPTRVRGVPVPADADIILAHSMVRAEKSLAAKQSFNLRAAEGRLACALLERELPYSVNTLADVIEHEGTEAPAMAGRILADAPAGLGGLAAALGMDEPEVSGRYLKGVDVPAGGFRVTARARHVLTEALRVDAAEEAALAGDAEELGRLMTDSHYSCSKDMEISCPELDILSLTARKSGAFGARLTGAGFGGCVVAIASCSTTEQVYSGIQNNYYDGWLRRNRPELLEHFHLDSCLFVATPSSGASCLF